MCVFSSFSVQIQSDRKKGRKEISKSEEEEEEEEGGGGGGGGGSRNK